MAALLLDVFHKNEEHALKVTFIILSKIKSITFIFFSIFLVSSSKTNSRFIFRIIKPVRSFLLTIADDLLDREGAPRELFCK